MLLFVPSNAEVVYLFVMQHGLQMQLGEVIKQKRCLKQLGKGIMEPHWESNQIQIPENYVRSYFA